MQPCSRERDCSDPDTDAQGRSVPRHTPTPFCPTDTKLIMQALWEIPTLYSELNHLLPRGSTASSGSPVSGTRERQLPLRMDVLTLQEDVEAELRDHAARLRGFVSPPRRVFIAVRQDSGYLCAHISALMALDAGETGAQAGIYYLKWQHHARHIQGAHKQAVRLPEACPACDVKSLTREYGSETTECRSCGKRISWKEYEDWCKYLRACDILVEIERKKK